MGDLRGGKLSSKDRIVQILPLTELFDLREGCLLPKAAYDRIGGAPGALGRRAEEGYVALDDSAKEATKEAPASYSYAWLPWGRALRFSCRSRLFVDEWQILLAIGWH